MKAPRPLTVFAASMLLVAVLSWFSPRVLEASAWLTTEVAKVLSVPVMPILFTLVLVGGMLAVTGLFFRVREPALFPALGQLSDVSQEVGLLGTMLGFPPVLGAMAIGNTSLASMTDALKIAIVTTTLGLIASTASKASTLFWSPSSSIRTEKSVKAHVLYYLLKYRLRVFLGCLAIVLAVSWGTGLLFPHASSAVEASDPGAAAHAEDPSAADLSAKDRSISRGVMDSLSGSRFGEVLMQILFAVCLTAFVFVVALYFAARASGTSVRVLNELGKLAQMLGLLGTLASFPKVLDAMGEGNTALKAMSDALQLAIASTLVGLIAAVLCQLAITFGAALDNESEHE
jgi:biopolymer transport protein ExbB/TolQ